MTKGINYYNISIHSWCMSSQTATFLILLLFIYLNVLNCMVEILTNHFLDASHLFTTKITPSDDLQIFSFPTLIS